MIASEEQPQVHYERMQLTAAEVAELRRRRERELSGGGSSGGSMSDKATAVVGSHPWAALAVALAVGASVGWLVKRKLFR